jgi:hypothetical protein
MGLLVTPIYGLFGGSLWALKLLAVAWSLATLALLMAAFRVVLGDVAALAGGLAYVFLPPSFQMVDVVLLGSHGETILFLAAGLLFVLTRSAQGFGRRRNCALFGALMGAGFLFSMQFLAVIPALIVAWWARAAQLGEGRTTIRGSLAVGGPGFAFAGLYLVLLGPRFADVLAMWWQFALVGAVLFGLAAATYRLRFLAVPGLFFLVASPTPWLTRSTKVVNKTLESRLLPDGIGGFFAKFWDAIAVQFANSWLFDDYGGLVPKVLFGTVVALGFVITVRRAFRPDPLAIFVLLHPLFFFCLYAATDLRLETEHSLDGMGSRYLMPVLASVTGWIAILVYETAGSGRRLLAWGLAAAPVCAGGLGLLPLLEPSIAFHQPPPRGSLLHHFSNHIAYAGGADLEARLSWIEKLDPQWAVFRPGYYRSTLFLPSPDNASTDALLSALDRAMASAEPLRDHLLFDLGYRAMASRLLVDPVAQKGTLRAVGTEGRAWFARGIGAACLGKSMLELSDAGIPEASDVVSFQFLQKLPSAWRGYAAQGAGFVTGGILTPFNQVPLETMKLAERKLLHEDLDNFFMGLALGYRTHYIEASWWVPEPGALRIERQLGPAARAAFRAGLMAPVDAYPEPKVGG